MKKQLQQYLPSNYIVIWERTKDDCVMYDIEVENMIVETNEMFDPISEKDMYMVGKCNIEYSLKYKDNELIEKPWIKTVQLIDIVEPEVNKFEFIGLRNYIDESTRFKDFIANNIIAPKNID